MTGALMALVEGNDKKTACLMEMKQNFSELARIYHFVELKWRRRVFWVAATLGLLPVIVGATTLFPGPLQPWIALMIATINVIIVVINVKLDMGERVADANMAYKAYEGLAW